jgi:hypothetical protein
VEEGSRLSSHLVRFWAVTVFSSGGFDQSHSRSHVRPSSSVRLRPGSRRVPDHHRANLPGQPRGGVATHVGQHDNRGIDLWCQPQGRGVPVDLAVRLIFVSPIPSGLRSYSCRSTSYG